ncbi:MAG: SPOR domain-containing protein [bacterium]
MTLTVPNSSADFDIAAELYQQKNYAAAFDAFTRLAEQGNPRAQTILALMHMYGEGTSLDNEKAFHWYHSAARAGYPPAQFNTGIMYSNGIGTTEDQKQAFYWLTESANQGFNKAKEKLEEIEGGRKPSSVDPELTSGVRDWNFRLPNRIRFAVPELAVASPEDTYRAQIGAMGTRTSANQLWELLLQTHTDLFDGLQPYFVASESSKRRVYRVQAGPFANYGVVSEFCERLLLHSVQAGCLPVRVQ